MRLARTEAMLSEQNKILHDTKPARQAQQRSTDHEEGKERLMKHKIQKTLQISPKAASSRRNCKPLLPIQKTLLNVVVG
jgi:hypothetical protein